MENNDNCLNPASGPFVGRWTINRKKCTTCCECIEACTRGLLYLEDKNIMIKNEYNCNQCGECVDACPYNAIVLT